jgi:hypothetical protein
MPRWTPRRRHCEAILHAYFKVYHARKRRLQHRLQTRRDCEESPQTYSSISSVDSDTSLEIDELLTSDSSESGPSNSLGSESSESTASLSSMELGLTELEDLETSDSEDSSSGFESEGDLSGHDGDVEDEDGMDFEPGDTRQRGTRVVRKAIEHMYARRYENARNTLPRGPAYLPHVLHTLKHSRPDLFRQELRVSPQTFDKILAKIKTDPVFTNNSQNAQLPVEHQLAIVLFCFGHDGNAASLQKVANWAGVGKGTVLLATHRCMTAILLPSFMSEAVRMPTPEEKEEAKAWVEAHSCRAWHDGWCFVDGTLVPLFDRPFWYGESYFDRKCNYSFNVQVSSILKAISKVSPIFYRLFHFPIFE